VACTRISKGKGVCGTCWAEDRPIAVEDVEKFPGHIACSSKSKSEIVVPLHDSKGRFIGLLDIDSCDLNSFDEVDVQWLQKLHQWLGRKL
jgi:L-methionine (R)-S-oxide reductase